MSQPLPIDAVLADIVAAVSKRGAVVVEASPGAGKTTRVPRALLDAALFAGQIVVLEPRRLAARMAASRVAFELGEDVGQTVGYQVRFESKTSARTRICFMTEGVLTRRLIADPQLRGIDAVILDELHERHLHTDLALVLLCRLRRESKKRLALAAMSATLDGAPVAQLLDAERICCDVPRFPVAIEYQPSREPLDVQIAMTARRLLRETTGGHLLAFLPGVREIRRATERCRALSEQENVMLVPLHGSLPAHEQDAAVAPSARRKLILATNVAESSITIDGVTCVIDSGLCKVASQAPDSVVSALRTETISRASAEQRRGRAGRTGPGRCIRLYGEAELMRRPEHATPEIARADLTELALAARMAGAEPRELPWLTAPPERALARAEQLLADLGAVTDRGVTDLGRRIARLPVHPRLGRAILEGERLGVARSVCAAAAILSEEAWRSRERCANLAAELERFEEALDSSSFGAAIGRLELDRGKAHAARRAFRQLNALADGATESGSERELAIAVAKGFPDRLAKRSGSTTTGAVVALCDGGSAALDDPSVLSGDGFAIALDAREGERGQTLRVLAALAIRADWIVDAFGDRIVATSDVTFDAASERVLSIDRLSYRNLVLEETRGPAPMGGVATDLLLDAARKAGLDASDAITELRERARHAARAGVIGIDEAIADSLRRVCEMTIDLVEVRAAPLAELVLAEHPELRRALDAATPARIPLPSGRDLAVHYPHDGAPFVASYLQDFFGMTESPRLAGQPLTIHLWAPNRRAVQVTSDLASFWREHYPTLRRSLMRRYPKHHWPEQPLDAKALRFKRDV
jgi:ATP-dependent helicase HrpB